MHTEGTILKLISGGERLILDACDGKRTIVTAKKFFATGLLDPNFRKWGTNKTSKPTPETDVLVYEMERNATFAQIFSSLGDDINQLCFTQHQIINFIEKHSSWLRIKGDGIFFYSKLVMIFLLPTCTWVVVVVYTSMVIYTILRMTWCE
ncbi:hypothetical protein CO134_02890 [Candidatus Kuenenbacteria bacterium CG_4_9_14_3_um_filter_39_14]|uniref:Uncharacterized protein n=1 Tax=Candidatus Kuenenbacteria bacterium CG_4_9_14_3_um_filter_39_14 TaxID=1974616 RepID=A0A2M7Z8L3_9BACT|nr:MAG: hypothetical protein CO134_02890 [Candidatus Kuenenbacteria bacterium CG_4_9_14_3_um_filter_39_14]